MGNCLLSPVNRFAAASQLPAAAASANYSARNRESNDTGSSQDDIYPNQDMDVVPNVTPNVKVYTFSQLKWATGNFTPDSLLGDGNLGMVFRGWVDETTLAPSSKIGLGIPVVVRRLNPGDPSLEQWKAEVFFLGKFSHPNIVKLLGYCRDDKELMLVYEYMHKGSLERHLFRNDAEQLSWETRLEIAMGAAQGLAFLQTTKKQVRCRFFTTANILLDREFNAKLSDFGTVALEGDSRFKHAQLLRDSNYDYAAPEYVSTGCWDNVYSFGMVLLEMITGLRAVDKSRPSGQRCLLQWVKPYLHKKDTLKTIIDPRLEGKYPVKAALETAELVLKCLEHLPKDRPSMDDVLKALERIHPINAP